MQTAAGKQVPGRKVTPHVAVVRPVARPGNVQTAGSPYDNVTCAASDRHLAFAFEAGGTALIAELEGRCARTRKPL